VKVFERILKVCVGKVIRVNYGRCSGSRGVGKCQIEGVLWAFDNLCMAVGVYNREGKIEKLVVIKKSEVESIEIMDKDLIREIQDFALEPFWGNDEH